MTKKQRIEHWQTITDGIIADYRKLDAACSAASDAGALDGNGPLFDAIWRAFGNGVDRVDAQGWIGWHIWDNDCGKAARKAGLDSKSLRAIRTTRQLARLIVETEDSTKSKP